MRNYRVLTSLLVLAFVLAFGMVACAEAVVENSYTVEARDLELNKASNALAVKVNGTDHYVLTDAAGNPLTDAPYIMMRANGTLFRVAVEEDVNSVGMIDATGKEMVAMQYGDVSYLNDHWQIGIVLEEATEENYDYKALFGDKKFFLVSQYDFYFDGTKVGSLGRLEYDYGYAYGTYLYIRNTKGDYTYYDKDFNKSAYEGDSSSSEFEERYSDKSIWHRGSNQQAFTASCTLEPNDVDRYTYFYNGEFLDLQGNVLGAGDYYTVYAYKGDYAQVKDSDGKVGLVDRSGNLVVPCEYDEIECTDAFFTSGYQMVVKDDKVGYIDLDGNVTCDFKYSASNVKTGRSPLTYLQDLDGKVIVLSAAIGELPERYDEVNISYSDTNMVFVAMKDGAAGVVDLYGNVVIPFDGTYDSVYDLSVSDDCSVIVGDEGNRMYTVYNIGFGAAE